MTQSAEEARFKELKDMIAQQNNTIYSLNKTIETMSNMLAEKDQRLAELTEELRLLRKKLFGSSKERTASLDHSEQLNLFAVLGLEPEPELVEAEYVEVKTHSRKTKKKSTFDQQFKNLEVRQVFVDTLREEDKICPACGTEMKPIGTQRIRRDVVHVRPKMYVIEYMATTYACPVCKDSLDPQFVKNDGAPPRLLKHSYVTPSLAAWVFYQKFALAVPFYRLERNFEELGGSINRTTMANCAIDCNNLYFKPMTDYFLREAVKRKFLMMDETPIQGYRC